jgi:hypothetical protein
MSRHAILFVLIAIACFGGAGAYLLRAVQRTSPGVAAPQQPPAGPPTLLTPGEALPPGPLLVFRRTSTDRYNGALGISPVSAPASTRLVDRLRCERVNMAAGKGVCLVADRGVFTTYRAVLFDDAFNPRGQLPLAGVPSRVQVAPDGKLAGTTVFVSGHAYSDGSFSTRTSIIDLQAGKWLVEDVETFTVRRNGQPIQSPDFNFWGVTFMPDGRSFYATLGTGGETLLVKGDVDARTMDVVEESVECPSLSPNGKRVAFKQRSGGLTGPVTWRLWVLDLDTGKRHPLAETRSVDDQAEWLDDEHVLYALPGGEGRSAIMDEWTTPADGSGEPRLFLPEAYSAGVDRADARS